MNSLPQGWHGILGTVKPSATRRTPENTSSVPTLRKKWNSPQSAVEARRAMPSTFQKGSMPLLPNGFQSKIVPPTKSSAKLKSSSSVQSHVPESPSRPAFKVKELQIEVAGLKKELSTVKAENMVLKVRVRRLDDENNQKSRQMEKLLAEKKSEINNRKCKESESALLLRQKCLRLECALKEKDLSLKKMVSEIRSVKAEELKDIVEKYHTQFGVSNGLGSDFFKSHKLLQQQSNGKLPNSRQGRTNIQDQASKSEIQKLRDMLHKLESENRNHRGLMKEKDQEIRRLKLQVQRQGYKSYTSSASLAASNCRLSQAAVDRNNLSVKKCSSTSLLKRPSTSQTIYQNQRIPLSSVASRKPSIQQPQIRTAVPKASTSEGSSTFIVAKSQAVPKVKPSVTKPKTFLKHGQGDVESKVQSMRENIAARKIQQGWRHHRKMLNASAAKEEQAVCVITSELQANKAREDRLNFFRSEDNQVQQLPNVEEVSIAQKVNAAFNSIWHD